jgi:type IV fimbrial biogenesis protein FimT
MGSKRTASGTTLIELMTVIGIAAVLMAIAIPSYEYVTNINRVSSEINGLLGDMQYARVEATKEGQTVTVCPSADGKNCLASTAWNGGWIVFSDPANVGTVDPGETVLRVRQAFSSADTAVSDNGIQTVTFNRDGFAQLAPAVTTVKVHDSTNNAAYTTCLAITKVGSMTTQKPAGGNNCT